jgi:hypothetical protein
MNIQEFQSDMKDALRNREALRLQVKQSARDALQKAHQEAIKHYYDTHANDEETQAERSAQTVESVHQREALEEKAQHA